MTAKKSTTPTATYTVTNCTVTNNSAANEHTRAAIEALAEAASANARAIERIAQALTGPPANMEAGIRVGGQ